MAGAGEPVVMLHASLGSKSQWGSLAEQLATRFRAIAIDLCGYGDNHALPTAATFTLDDEVRLVDARLDRLVTPEARIHVVGHSYGALVALRYAQSHRDRVASLSLYEPVAFRLLDDNDAALRDIAGLADRVTRLLATGCRRNATQAFVDYWSGDGSYGRLPPAAQANVAHRIDKVPLDFQAAWHWRLSTADLGAIVAPTLLLAGTRSPIVVRRIVSVLARMLPNHRTWWFDAGHMAPIEQPKRINYWIKTFVEACAEGIAAGAPRAAVAPASWVSALD